MKTPAHGFLLLPVALTLVVVGALAFAMTRDAGTSITRTDAEYDTDVARYLAEAAMNYTRWKNNQTNCGSTAATFAPTPLYRFNLASGNVGTTAADLVGSMTLNSISVVSNNASSDKGNIIVDVSSTTTTSPAASSRIARTVFRYDLSTLKTAVISGGGGANTFIYSGPNPVPQGSTTYLELTDNGTGDQSYGLVRFSFSTLTRNPLLKDATLRLRRTEGETSPLDRKLDIHRVTTAWDPTTATWNVPWSRPGGDYAANPVASSPISGNSYYYWRIDGLVAGWMDGTVPNNGLLLKPTKLYKSRFSAFTNSNGDGPQVTVNYYDRCT